ncbi:electron transport complex subunit E [Magnetospirillum sp. UT-4]|uniref:electron transport complex subunit E n=1 Tax=Magnetospirillum sp. UT-4 TaxID=2681467 RepID=UPI00138644E4|nr:electron transport complex subunit E [Magnetospirillum sp. UT-4]CAA7626402.1 putative inner membrane NADH-quinone reductase [Magnetospirillum sp. UT-4]
MIYNYRRIARDGIWDNNGVFVMMLGLCPAMAMSNSATNGFGMGLATALVMTGANALVSALRHVVSHEVRVPAYITIVAATVTSVDLAMKAYMPALYNVLGLFIPLIVANCVPFARIEAFASKSPILPAAADGLFMGLGFTLALTVLGAFREVLGSGTLFADASLLLGPAFKAIEMRLFPAEAGVLLMILPPGAFIGTGILLVGKRLIDARMNRGIQAGTAHCTVEG